MTFPTQLKLLAKKYKVRITKKTPGKRTYRDPVKVRADGTIVQNGKWKKQVLTISDAQWKNWSSGQRAALLIRLQDDADTKRGGVGLLLLEEYKTNTPEEFSWSEWHRGGKRPPDASAPLRLVPRPKPDPEVVMSKPNVIFTSYQGFIYGFKDMKWLFPKHFFRPSKILFVANLEHDPR